MKKGSTNVATSATRSARTIAIYIFMYLCSWDGDGDRILEVGRLSRTLSGLEGEGKALMDLDADLL